MTELKDKVCAGEFVFHQTMECILPIEDALKSQNPALAIPILGLFFHIVSSTALVWCKCEKCSELGEKTLEMIKTCDREMDEIIKNISKSASKKNK